MSEWDTGWDPYEELMLHRNNIQQLALAVNTGSELMKELGAKYNHQQELIVQLMFQNKKLTADLARLTTELQMLKVSINTQRD